MEDLSPRLAIAAYNRLFEVMIGRPGFDRRAFLSHRANF